VKGPRFPDRGIMLTAATGSRSVTRKGRGAQSSSGRARIAEERNRPASSRSYGDGVPRSSHPERGGTRQIRGPSRSPRSCEGIK